MALDGCAVRSRWRPPARGCGRRWRRSTSPAATSPRSPAGCTPRRSTWRSRYAARREAFGGHAARPPGASASQLADVETDLVAARLLVQAGGGAARRAPTAPWRRRTRSASPGRRAASGDRLQRGARRLRLAARPSAGPLHRAGQDAAGRGRHGRDPAPRDRARSRAAGGSARARKSSGLTSSRNLLNSSTSSSWSSGSPPNSIAESSITWSATKIGALVRTASASASDGRESISISEPFTCSVIDRIEGVLAQLGDGDLARPSRSARRACR